MIKVLIVDDEPKLREGLTKFIPWESYGFTIVGTAANGNEALEKYRELSPSLMIADIRMPGMDGLQLVETLRKEDSKLHILILSGYADFEYAKKAITHRADGYLLKPVDEDELIEYLEQIRKQVQTEQEAEHWSGAAEEWSREVLIHSLLTDPPEEESLALREKAERLGVWSKEYQMLVVEIHPKEGDEPDKITAELRHLADRFEECKRGYCMLTPPSASLVLHIPLLNEQMRQSVYRELSELLGHSEFTVAVGPKVTSLCDLHGSYSAARGLIHNKFFYEAGHILSEQPELSGPSTSTYSEEDPSSIEREALEERLYLAIEIGNANELKALVRGLGSQMVKEGSSEQEIKRYFAELLNRLLGKLSSRNPETFDSKKGFADQLVKLYKQRNIYSLYEYIDDMLCQFAEPFGGRSKEQEVKHMLDLIHRNYSDNLKLETLASIFNYNSAYLGKLFKNATGEYFNTYLDKVRIEQAKRFLQEGMKVYQVAEKVGYTNVDYFHIKFRKYVGTSPSAYRKNTVDN